MRLTRWSYCLLSVVVFSIIGVSPVYAAAVPTYVAGQTGVDISWPKANCSIPTRFLRSWAIVGVNGGLDFRQNPCLRAEVARVSSNYSLYANTGYPGITIARQYVSQGPRHCNRDDPICVAYNYGYAAGKYTVAYAASQNVHATQWWLDVETENSWTDDLLANRASIAGEAAAIQHYTVVARVGVYSYPGQWDLLTGDWRNGMPNWAASGSLQRKDAKTFCTREDFTGGGTWLAQYTVKLDEDYVCQTH